MNNLAPQQPAITQPQMNELPLRDIHLPDAVSLWPPAIGWWILVIVIAALAFGLYKFYKIKKHKQKTAYRKMALDELKIIKQSFSQQDSSIECLRAISHLLRRIALSYLPREKVASLTGTQWVSQLNHLAQQAGFTSTHTELLIHGPYQQQFDYDQNELFESCENWIKQLPAQPDKAGEH